MFTIEIGFTVIAVASFYLSRYDQRYFWWCRKINSFEFGCGFGIHNINGTFLFKDYIYHGGMLTLKGLRHTEDNGYWTVLPLLYNFNFHNGIFMHSWTSLTPSQVANQVCWIFVCVHLKTQISRDCGGEFSNLQCIIKDVLNDVKKDWLHHIMLWKIWHS